MKINPVKTQFVGSTDSVQLSVYKYSTNINTKPDILFSHATGFHGRCFDPVISSLINEHDCTSFDYRGYGDSQLDPDWPLEWQGYGDDALAVARSMQKKIIAVGHSMGGAALVMAALVAPELFQALILYEPIIFPTYIRDATESPREPSPLVEGARRRRTTFASRDEAFTNYFSKPPMNIFDERSLHAYVDHGFKDAESGVVLKSRPEHEARTYEMGAIHKTWDQLNLLRVPTWVVAGVVAPMQPSSWTESIAKEIQNAKFIQWPDAGHFGPMQQPDRLAQLVTDVVGITSANS